MRQLWRCSLAIRANLEGSIRNESIDEKGASRFPSPSRPARIAFGSVSDQGLARAIAKDRVKHGTFLIPVRLEACSIPMILSQWNAKRKITMRRHFNISLGMIKEGATHIAFATDHRIESFRNDLGAGCKTGDGIEPALSRSFLFSKKFYPPPALSDGGKYASEGCNVQPILIDRDQLRGGADWGGDHSQVDLFAPDGQRRLFEALGVRVLPTAPSTKPAVMGAGLGS